jgi:hypothetical protein
LFVRKNQDSSLSEEKEAKRLLFLVLGSDGRRATVRQGLAAAKRCKRNKSLFASFSSEKEEFSLFWELLNHCAAR